MSLVDPSPRSRRGFRAVDGRPKSCGVEGLVDRGVARYSRINSRMHNQIAVIES